MPGEQEKDDNQTDDEPVIMAEEIAEEVVIPEVLPILLLDDVIIYPHVVLPLTLSEESDVRAVDQAALKERVVGVIARNGVPKDADDRDPLKSMGCAVSIMRLLRLPDGEIRILARGLERISIDAIIRRDPYIAAKVTTVAGIDEDDTEVRALARSVVSQFQRIVSLSPQMPDELGVAAMNIDDHGHLADLLSTTLNLDVRERQELLETISVKERLRRLNQLIGHELELVELSSKIQSQVKSEVDRSQREYFLRQQLKAIQEELGEGDERAAEIGDLRKRLQKAKLPREAAEEAERELDRLSRMPPAAAEYTVARTYLDWMLAMPWRRQTRDRLDVTAASKVLDADHYDLEKVKERILEFLAVRRLKPDSKAPILCFVGPPGTGKTSLGRSIARAMGRKFVRISLGGVHDEAEIRGHRRTYVGALPGRIIQGIRKAGSRNPVFMLDEIDKLGADFRGDPSSALLEVLDPEQNSSFTDHYLDVPFDLSRVMFICTANILQPVPPALRDRMEVLELPGYSIEEKVRIAHEYLVPRQKEENGLGRMKLEFPDEILQVIVEEYTFEAGLRNLEREIANVCRKVATEAARRRRKPKARTLTPDDVRGMLGPRRFFPEVAERTSEPGVATGLAWTASGGEIIFIEAIGMRGSGKLILTGQLGDVMQESAQAALSYVRAHAREFGVNPRELRQSDIHIHVPAAAIRKDGPSAGVTIATALISLCTDTSIRPDVAMSGEISLRGRVLPVGGIKEKILAAHRAGIRTIILPTRNEGDVEEVPEHVRRLLDIRFVETLDEALPIAFGKPPGRRRNVTGKKTKRKSATKRKPAKKKAK